MAHPVGRPLRILFVGMGHAVHLARWTNQLNGAEWDVHVFPTDWPCGLHQLFKNVTFHGTGWLLPTYLSRDVRTGRHWPWRHGVFRAQCVYNWVGRLRPLRVRELAYTIRCLNPDVVYAMEMQHGGYLAYDALAQIDGKKPPFVYNCWGNDLIHFGNQSKHGKRIRAVLSACDYLVADCDRDIALTQMYGFRGESLGVFPGPGAFDIVGMRGLCVPGPTSKRMTVAVKGYEQPFGRALMALRAIDLGAEQLRQFSFEVFSATPKVRKEAARIAREKHLSINVLPYVPNEEIVALMGRSRFAVGVSASDGVPNAMLEAMIMGALPIQTNTAALDGWIENGVNGLSVDLSVDNILQAMIRAATDDRLVDDAARMNGDITERRLATTVVVPRVHAMYRHVAEHGSIAADAGRPGEV